MEALGSEYKLVVLAAGSSDQMLADQASRFRPEMVALNDLAAAKRLKSRVSQLNIEVLAGEEGLIRAATWPGADLVVMAQVGFSGFKPLVAALQAGKSIALANKESLVVGGDLLKRLGLLDRERIFPVDSEHSAIWQARGQAKDKEIARIYLTASGGPFYGWSAEQLKTVTPAQALKHPNWQMGKKITIDSATMMNKGLEVIEAKWLFNLELEQIEVLIHRQSIVHSMVEYIDGTIMAQLGTPDMRAPIQHALTYPERKAGLLKRFKPAGCQLTFDNPDRANFPCLELAYSAAKCGGTMPAVLNAANEIAVAAFLEERISFTEIPVVIEEVMARHVSKGNYSLEEAVAADNWSRLYAQEVIAGLQGRMNK